MRWLPLALASSLFGCAEMDADVGVEEDLALSDNGLSTTNGLSCTNGLSTTNGLSVTNGLSTTNGLSVTNGLMTTAGGRNQISYLVRCALPAGRSIVKGSYTFAGLLGLAPEWEYNACGSTCQEMVSACLLAHVNTAGLHIPLWIVAQNPAVGWGQDPEFPNQEGAFFGNVFQLGAHGTDPSKAPGYYCAGAKYSVNAPKGRVGGLQTSPPYVNAFGTAGAGCAGASRCADADYPNGSHGFKACAGWNHVVTVWRQNIAYTTSTSSGENRSTGRGFRWR